MNTRFDTINGSYSWEDGTEIKYQEWHNGEGHHSMEPRVPKLVFLKLVQLKLFYIDIHTVHLIYLNTTLF